MKNKLRIIEAPKKRAICENKMRYDLMIGENIVGELWFNINGYVIDTKLSNFINSCEQSISKWKREVSIWNKLYSNTNTISKMKKK